MTTEHLGEKYDGVTVSDHYDSEQVGIVRPASSSKVREHYENLPETRYTGGLRKIGLTDKGYVVYQNVVTGRFVYCTIYVNPLGEVGVGLEYGREESRKPEGSFGDGWHVAPK